MSRKFNPLVDSFDTETDDNSVYAGDFVNYPPGIESFALPEKRHPAPRVFRNALCPSRSVPFFSEQSRKIFEASELVNGKRIFYAPPDDLVWKTCPTDRILAAEWHINNYAYGDARDTKEGIPTELVKRPAEIVLQTTVMTGTAGDPYTAMSVKVPHLDSTATGFPLDPVGSSVAAEASQFKSGRALFDRVDILRESTSVLCDLMPEIRVFYDKTMRNVTQFTDRANSRYGKAGRKMIEALDVPNPPLRLVHSSVLDLGAQPGSFSDDITGKFPTAEVVTVDHPDFPLKADIPNVTCKLNVDLERPDASERIQSLLSPGGFVNEKERSGDRRLDGDFALVAGDGCVTQTAANVKSAARWETANARILMAQMVVALDTTANGGWMLFKAFALRTNFTQGLLAALSRVGSITLVKPSLSRGTNEEFYIVVQSVKKSRARILSRALSAALEPRRDGTLATKWVVSDEFFQRPDLKPALKAIAKFAHQLAMRQLVHLMAMQSVAVTWVRKGRLDVSAARALHFFFLKEYSGVSNPVCEAFIAAPTGTTSLAQRLTEQVGTLCRDEDTGEEFTSFFTCQPSLVAVTPPARITTDMFGKPQPSGSKAEGWDRYASTCSNTTSGLLMEKAPVSSSVMNEPTPEVRSLPVNLPRPKAHPPPPDTPPSSIKWLWYNGLQPRPGDPAKVFMTKLLYWLSSRGPWKPFTAMDFASAQGAVAQGLVPKFEHAVASGLIYKEDDLDDSPFPVYCLNDIGVALLRKLPKHPYVHLDASLQQK